MDSEVADQEYNPRIRVPDFAHFFSQWRQQSERARADLPWRELAYGPADSDRLDLFASRQAHAPLLVFIHGGYWRALDKRDFSWIAPAFVAAGAAVAVLNYGLAPSTPIESMVSQVRGAVSWLAAHADALGIASDRIVVSGHSAGGHLTAMLLTVPNVVHAAVVLSGIFDLRPLIDASFLQNDLQLSLERAARLSPILIAPAAAKALVLAVGEAESGEFHRQSEAFKSAWSNAPSLAHLAAWITGPISVPGRNHFSICDALVDPGNPLFQTTAALLGLSGGA